MAVAFRSFSFSGNSLVGSDPAGAAADDILFACVYFEEPLSITVTPPAGWSKVFGASTINAVEAVTGLFSDWQTSWWWIRRGGSAPALTWTKSGGSGYAEITVHAYSGAWTGGNPWSFATTAIRDDSASRDYPAVSGTTATANEMLVFAGTQLVGDATLMPPTGFTERSTNPGDTSTSDKVQAVAGATGSIMTTWTGGALDPGISFLAGLAASDPSGGGGPTDVHGVLVGTWGTWVGTVQGNGITPAAAPEPGWVTGSSLSHMGAAYLGAPDTAGPSNVSGVLTGSWGGWSGAVSGTVDTVYPIFETLNNDAPGGANPHVVPQAAGVTATDEIVVYAAVIEAAPGAHLSINHSLVQLDENSGDGGGYYLADAVFYSNRADQSAITSYDVTFAPGPLTDGGGFAIRTSNTNGVDVAAGVGYATGNDSTGLAAPAVTTSVDHCLAYMAVTMAAGECITPAGWELISAAIVGTRIYKKPIAAAGSTGTPMLVSDAGTADTWVSVWALLPATGVSEVFGALTGAWGGWAGTVSGVVEVPATLVGSWGSWVGTVQGGVEKAGTLLGAWGGWSGAVQGSVEKTGSALGSWGGWSGSADGTPEVLGAATGAWGGWSGTALGTGDKLGVLAGSWGGWSATVSGQVEVVATAQGDWGGWTGIALGEGVSGATDVQGKLDGSWGGWSGSAQGNTEITATATGDWGGWVGTATAVNEILGRADGDWGTWVGEVRAGVQVLGSAVGAWGGWVGTIVVTGVAQGILVQTIKLEHLEQTITIEQDVEQTIAPVLSQTVTIEHIEQTIQLYDQTGQTIILG